MCDATVHRRAELFDATVVNGELSGIDGVGG
jgi:hypothetical protein